MNPYNCLVLVGLLLTSGCGPDFRGQADAVMALHSRDGSARRQAIRWFAASGDTTAIPDIAARLSFDPDPNVRIEAARALGAFGPDARAAIPALVRALADPVIRVREAADRAKPSIGFLDIKSIPKMIELCWDPSTNVSATSLLVLADIQAHAFVAVPVLTGLRNDPRPIVARDARVAIDNIDPYHRWTGPPIPVGNGSAWSTLRDYWKHYSGEGNTQAIAVMQFISTIESSP